MHDRLKHTAALALLLISLPWFAPAQGKVYLVLGSDTAIWDGMGVSTFHDHYSLDLFMNPARNAYKVMNAPFRSSFVDSYGQPVKMTWWMMQGNIFRYADNTDVPIANTMTLYLMKKYHGAAVQSLGDELTLHYHTFVWNDDNNDGSFYWNQARSFLFSKDDFFFTLAQDLLEEQTFPVSFRSGWHAMDNAWQHELNQLIPFCLHDDYPAVRQDTVEPIDNVYDWSKSSANWVPFHPSDTNYQFPGNSKGWNTRSKHMQNITAAEMDSIFARAARGIDQVPCIWAHLPEDNFLESIKRVDSLAHRSALKYPAVMFRYCTAVEAMQRWLGTTDHTPPVVTAQEEIQGDNVAFLISADEPIFQPSPFVAVKDVYERYLVLSSSSMGTNAWKTSPVPRATLAKVGVALCDNVGNQTIRVIRYLPDDIYIDNLDAPYQEVKGTWGTAAAKAWGTDARSATLSGSDTARVHWNLSLSGSVQYNLFIQMPAVTNPAGNIRFDVFSHGTRIDSAFFSGPPPTGKWVYLCSPVLDSAGTPTVEMTVMGTGQAGKTVAADVLKLSALVRDRELHIEQELLQFGTVSQFDTVHTSLTVANRGISPLHIQGIACTDPRVSASASFPLIVPPMSSIPVPLNYVAATLGSFADTLRVLSDDPVAPQLAVPFTATVSPYFFVADNDDALRYSEYGAWAKSNAQAYGPSSRYSNLSGGTGSKAVFTARLRLSGPYDLQFIVPTTANAANKALYLVTLEGRTIDSLYFDQNAGSGGWVQIGRYWFPADSIITVSVINTGVSTVGTVLRADAIRFKSVVGTTAVNDPRARIPAGYALEQNYPNPFNPETGIRYQVSGVSHVGLRVYDLLGREVATLVNERKSPGTYEVRFDASGLPSGVYFCRMTAGSFSQTRKLVLMK